MVLLRVAQAAERRAAKAVEEARRLERDDIPRNSMEMRVCVFTILYNSFLVFAEGFVV